MSSDPNIQDSPTRGGFALKALVVGLLLIHVVWICIHLSLVAHEQINPWKLGGYGMYTVPNNLARTHVYLFDEQTQSWGELQDGQVNSFQFDTTNNLHVFRCHAPNEASMIGFMHENPHLRYRPLTLALSEQLMDRNPIGASRKIYATVEISWANETRFGYRGEICGTKFSGTVDYEPPI